MLEKNERKRITLPDALQHEWFKKNKRDAEPVKLDGEVISKLK